jgi:hypothetical protein
LLAVMDSGEKLAPKIDAARKKLSQVGIELRLMTLTTHPISDDPYLH